MGGLLYINSVDEDFTCILFLGSLIRLKDCKVLNMSAAERITIVIDIYHLTRAEAKQKSRRWKFRLYDNHHTINNQFHTGYAYDLLMPSFSVRGLFTRMRKYHSETFWHWEPIDNYRIIQGTDNLWIKKMLYLQKIV